MSDSTVKHVMILGCGRSGTSIFGELFDHLIPFSYYSEPPFSALVTMNFHQPIAVKVPTESEGYPPSPGLSFPLSALSALIPSRLQYYWQVRHPLDAICSLRVGIANNWGHHPKPPDWQEWLDRPLLEQCAHHWAYLNTIGYQQVRDFAKVKKFEDMLDNPFQFARSIAEEVGLDHATYEHELADWAKRVQNTNNENFVEAETSKNYSRKDHHVRVGRWRENLTLAQVADLLPIIRDAAKTFDYDLPEGV